MAGAMRHIGLIFVLAGSLAAASSGTDKGYVFLGPHTVEGSVPLKDGTVVEAIHQGGVVVSENAESPWNHATFFAQGSRVKSRYAKNSNSARSNKAGSADWPSRATSAAPFSGALVAARAL